jgi:alkylated DNA repair dioxygenase AlkB
MKPFYTDNFVENADDLFNALLGLDWLDAKQARKEYFMSDQPRSYFYGNMDFKYDSAPFSPEVLALMEKLNLENSYNVCFLNLYLEAQNALGWHSDDSPEMSHDHPIAVISVGAERDIWHKKRDFKGEVPDENKQLLRHGSLFVMPAGFQKDNLHKIPKHDRPCGTRISLTFRRYI